METKKEIKSNPNGANQFSPDPRQSLFLSYYLDPKSETFSNAYQSAIRAGYEESYAEVVKAQMPKWLSESLRDSYLIGKAEENLKRFLEMEDNDTQRLKVKADISKFIVERLNKQKYSQKSEIGGTITHINIDSDIAEKNNVITPSTEDSSEGQS